MNHICTIQKEFFYLGTTKSLSFRIAQLKRLRTALLNYEPVLLHALAQDLGKSHFESYETELGVLLEEIEFNIKHLPGWMKPKPVKTSILHFPSTSKIFPEPLGTVLIIAPWNYPLHLAIGPLIAAIAAGNCAVVKPSQDAPRTSEAVSRMLSKAFPSCYITTIQGGQTQTEQLLKQPFDHIFFTGSPRVGKLVMKAAAENLIPVTLELGGKSPCIVDRTANLALAAKRIIWGKCLNAGQTCVAPDYVLVERCVKAPLLTAMKHAIHQFYGQDPLRSPDYPRLINRRQFDRLSAIIAQEPVFTGGQSNRDSLKIAPTILEPVGLHSPCMQEEIFGPLLPVLTFDSLQQLPGMLRTMPKPLALYLFSEDKAAVRSVLHNISFGGGCINDTIIHLTNHNMPFGGVGNSGMGSYHGESGFRTFTHEKSILEKSNDIDLPFRYPPYKHKFHLLKKLMK